MKHRNRFITIGRFPTISLSQARTEAKRLFAEFTLGKTRPRSITYQLAVELFLQEKTKSRRASTVDSYKGLLTRLNFQGQVAEITPEEVRQKLDRRKNYNHYLVALKVLFKWCIKRRYIEHDPTLGLSQETRAARARVLTDDELWKIWQSTVEPTTFNGIVRLLVLTGQRRSEIAALDGAYFSHNQQTICLPANISKNGKEHLLPIGPMAHSLLTVLPNAGLLFHARGKPSSPFSGWSKAKRALDHASSVRDWTLHDIRRTFRTIHAKIGTPAHIAERLVNHVSAQSEMERTYNLHRYTSEMRHAMEAYEKTLERILGG